MARRESTNILSFREIQKVAEAIESLGKTREFGGPQELAEVISSVVGFKVTPHNIKHVVRVAEIDISFKRSSTGMAGVLRGFRSDIDELQDQVQKLTKTVQILEDMVTSSSPTKVG